MAEISYKITDTVSINSFNRGLADQIFDSVHNSGPKIVVKNNKPECVLMSLEEYLSLMEELNNARLLVISNERLANFKGNALSQEKMNKILGITENDLADYEDVGIE